MKTLLAAAVALLVAAAGAAQTTTAKSETRVKVKDGKEMKVTGCVERNPAGSFMLTHVASRDGTLGNYMLVDKDADDLEDHIGHRVEIKGKVADKDDDARIETRTKTEVKVADDTRKTETRSVLKGDLTGLPFLGVKSIRMIAKACP